MSKGRVEVGDDGGRTVFWTDDSGGVSVHHATAAELSALWEAVAEESRDIHGHPDASARRCRIWANEKWEKNRWR
jgi:ABC-type nitrate/sulfonate/bicarbonate transport system substrate-binding protein